MFISIIFVLFFLLCLAGVVLLPKTKRQINGIKALVMGTMAIFCYQSLAAFVYNKIGVRVDLKSIGASMVFADIFLWGSIIRRKNVQKIFFRKSDIVSLIVLAVFVCAISLHMFTPNLRLSYVNTDPANHFNMAMVVVKTGKLDSVYFSAFIDAMFIQLFAPILTVAKYYKAFIAADVFMHVLEIWMFYVLVLTVSDKKITRILAPVFAVGYFFGYPAYSYMTGGFVYWGVGVMILIFMVYALLLFERHPRLWKHTGILLLLGAYANSCCNRLFIPVNYLALFVALFSVLMKGRKRFINLKIINIVLVVLVFALFAVVFLFWDTWGGSVNKFVEYISVPGGIYRSMYADLIFFVPAMVYVCYFVFFERRYSKVISLMSICMVLCTVVMYIFLYNGWMSNYYYYKIYYNLWLFGWLFVVASLDIMDKKRQLVGFFSYASMIAGIAVLTLTNYDYNMWNRNPDYNGEYATKNLFSLYRYNMDSLLTDYENYTMPVELMEVYTYAVEELKDEKIPALTTSEEYFYWFDGMRGQNTRKYDANKNELMDTLRRMSKDGISKIMVVKDDPFYQEYKSYFDLCKVVYENEKAAILTYPGSTWCKITDQVKEYSREKLRLYTYVRKNLKGQRVPMMAEKSACIDYVIYTRRTDQRSTDCYPWNFSPKENLEKLNELGAQYVLLLYEDPFYQKNQYYFDTQETVYENSAGKIVKCVGGEWSTEYK